jgi:hypothetical protein
MDSTQDWLDRFYNTAAQTIHIDDDFNFPTENSANIVNNFSFSDSGFMDGGFNDNLSVNSGLFINHGKLSPFCEPNVKVYIIKPSDTSYMHNSAVGAQESNARSWTESSVDAASYSALGSKFPYHGDYGAATPQPINLDSYASATEISNAQFDNLVVRDADKIVEGRYIRRWIRFGR